MEWQAIVFALQILLLATSWVLFQKARAELSAKAVETPVLNEVRALQRSVKQLLAEIEAASDSASAQVESRCEKARELLAALDRTREQTAEQTDSAPVSRRPLPAAPRPKRTTRVRPSADAGWMAEQKPAAQAVAVRRETKDAAVKAAPDSAYAARRQEVYSLTDAGEPLTAIARQTGISEGEIETWLGLRKNRC